MYIIKYFVVLMHIVHRRLFVNTGAVQGARSGARAGGRHSREDSSATSRRADNVSAPRLATAAYIRRARSSPGTLPAARSAPSLTDRSTTYRITMAVKFVVLVACFALAQGMVKREASTPLQDLEKHATEFQKTFSEQLNALVNSKNTQEVNKALKEGSDSVLQQLSALSSSLQSALADANGKAKSALEQTQANLQRTAEQLRKDHPDVERQASALRDKLQQAVQSTVAETQKLAKEVSANIDETNKKLAPKIKNAYDDFVRQAEEVQKKIQEAAKKQ